MPLVQNIRQATTSSILIPMTDLDEKLHRDLQRYVQAPYAGRLGQRGVFQVPQGGRRHRSHLEHWGIDGDSLKRRCVRTRWA
jgi:hypothetical protein